LTSRHGGLAAGAALRRSLKTRRRALQIQIGNAQRGRGHRLPESALATDLSSSEDRRTCLPQKTDGLVFLGRRCRVEKCAKSRPTQHKERARWPTNTRQPNQRRADGEGVNPLMVLICVKRLRLRQAYVSVVAQQSWRTKCRPGCTKCRPGCTKCRPGCTKCRPAHDGIGSCERPIRVVER